MVSQEFVAERLWLLVAVVTPALTALAAVFGGILSLPGVVVALLVTGVPIVGWLLVTPLLLFFGEEIAAALVGSPTADGTANDADPVASLKREYANGEIDETTFEHRLERLLAVDETAVGTGHAGGSDRDRAEPAGARSAETRRADEDVLERE